MGPPGGGRNDITPRFVRHLNIIGIDEFDDETLTHVFTSIVGWQFKRGYPDSVAKLDKVQNTYCFVFHHQLVDRFQICLL